MGVDEHVIFTILFFLGCVSACLLSVAGYAQSPNVPIAPGASPPAYLTEGPVPGAYIVGYVLDEEGNPVPGATVSLLQDGRLWHSKYVVSPGDNPQITRVAYTNESGLGFLREGGFLFGFASPGEYSLTAEKDGRKNASVRVNVGNGTLSPGILDLTHNPIMVNITLSGYHVPTLSPEQRSYTGAIAGNLRTASGLKVAGVDMSLWRDGRLVDMPGNPQSSFDRDFSGTSVDYLFEHLAPGRYTVRAEYFAGDDYNDTVTLDVGTGAMRTDIVLSHAHMSIASIPLTSFTPTVGVFSASSPGATTPPPAAQAFGSSPTPALPGLFALLMFGVVAYFLRRKN